MKTLILGSIAFLTSFTSAISIPRSQADTLTDCDVSSSQFYLVTAASPMCSSTSSDIPMVSATSLFAPFHQANLFLRTTGPGYLSLPVFTLLGGSLHTFSSDGVGQGNYTYSPPAPVDGTELQFRQGEQGDVGLTLTGGFLLGVGGVTDQWTLCEGDLGQSVVCCSSEICSTS
jgi:hypothetical protein